MINGNLIVVCPVSEDGVETFPCPLATRDNFRCIDEHEVCNGRNDCPGNEDEVGVICMYYNIVSKTKIN